MYLISEEEYNMRGPLPITPLTYRTTEEKAQERDFKSLGKLENQAKQLYDTVLKYSCVTDRNEWFKKQDDTLPVAGTNIVNLITYAVRGSGSGPKPYGWSVWVKFLKRNGSIPHTLFHKNVRTEVEAVTPPAVHVRGQSPPPVIPRSQSPPATAQSQCTNLPDELKSVQ